MKFKTILKDLRLKHGLSQEDLGKIIGVGRTTISMYESGNIVPRQEGLLKIASYFDVSVDYLTGISSSKEAETSSPYLLRLDKELKDLDEKLLNAADSSVSVLYQNHELQPNRLNIIEKQLCDLINLIDLIVTEDV